MNTFSGWNDGKAQADDVVDERNSKEANGRDVVCLKGGEREGADPQAFWFDSLLLRIGRNMNTTFWERTICLMLHSHSERSL
jgi:hypothetical protein